MTVSDLKLSLRPHIDDLHAVILCFSLMKNIQNSYFILVHERQYGQEVDQSKQR
jgi:hypothetical protein